MARPLRQGRGRPPSNSFTYSRIAGFNALDRGLRGHRLLGRPTTRADRAADRPVRGRRAAAADRQPAGGQPGRDLDSLAGGGGLASVVNGVAHRRHPRPARRLRLRAAGPRRRRGRRAAVRIRAASRPARRCSSSSSTTSTRSGAATLPNGLVAPRSAARTLIPGPADGPAAGSGPPAGDRHPAGDRPTDSRPATGCGSASPPPTRRTPPRPSRPSTRSPSTVGGDACRRRRHADRHPGPALALGAGRPARAARARARRRARPGPPAAAARRRNGRSRATPTSRWSSADCARSTPTASSRFHGGLHGAPRAGGRPARAERRRQDHHPAGADGADPADRRRDPRLRPPAGARARRCCPGSARWSRGPASCRTCPAWQNLRLYWRATGRPAADAHFDEALEIAGLGDGLHRRVKTYSHGMRQRLAIAQAMLGLPELLVLDEPTDGLDPPQIAEMRRVLQRYATDGRAVLVSSHLLAEVEQTCTARGGHDKGEIVASGPVDEIVGESPSVQFDVSDVDAAATVLGELPGVRSSSSAGQRRSGGGHQRHAAAREVVAELVGPASGWTGWCRGAAWRTRSWPWSATTPRGAETADDDTHRGRCGYRPSRTFTLSDRVPPAGVAPAYPVGPGLHGAAAADHPGRLPVRLQRQRRRHQRRGGEFAALVDLATPGGLNFTLFSLLVSAVFLLVVVVALFCGDTVASEASWGSLRYLLAIPVPRARLLGGEAGGRRCCTRCWRCCCWPAPRWLAGTAPLRLAPLRTAVAAEIPAGAGLLRLAAHPRLPRGDAARGGAAWRSCCRCRPTRRWARSAARCCCRSCPASSTRSPRWDAARRVLPTHYSDAWLGLLSDPLQTDDLVKGCISALIYATLFFSFAWWRFVRKDVVS